MKNREAKELAKSTSMGAMSSIMPHEANGQHKRENCGAYFQMPLHYPQYKNSDYEIMPEWKFDCLLKEYGLQVTGDVEQKRKFAMGTFLWNN